MNKALTECTEQSTGSVFWREHWQYSVLYSTEQNNNSV